MAHKLYNKEVHAVIELVRCLKKMLRLESTL